MSKSTASDRCGISERGGATLSDEIIQGDELNIEENRLNCSFDGGVHFDDVPYTNQYNYQRSLFRNNNIHPRQVLMEKLNILGIEYRPKPMGSTTTQN